MKILVFGAGAIGSVFGGFLAKAGEDVVMLGRPTHMEAVKSKGLDISGIWGDHHVDGMLCYTNSLHLKEDHAGTFDLILLTVKSYDTIPSMAEIRNIVKNETYVLSLQNGIGNIEAIAKVVGEEQTIGGRVITGAEMTQPGSVKVTVSADDVVIGKISGNTLQEDVDKISGAFNIAGIKTRTTDDIRKVIWGKLLYSCALNALASVLGLTYGELLESPYSKDIMRRVINEIYIVAEKNGIVLDPAGKDEYLKLLFNRLIPLTSAHKPSMLHDIERKKRTEIDYLNGMIFELGKNAGVSAQTNLLLTELIKFKERKT